MPKNIAETREFRRDLKRMKKRGKDMGKLNDVVQMLSKGQALPFRMRPHPLTGNWRPFWDCHIEPDWLLIYLETDDTIQLYRTGSHSDLFK